MLGEHVEIFGKNGITSKNWAEKTGLSIGYISKSSAISPTCPCPPLRKLARRSDILTYLFMEVSTTLV